MVEQILIIFLSLFVGTYLFSRFLTETKSIPFQTTLSTNIKN